MVRATAHAEDRTASNFEKDVVWMRVILRRMRITSYRIMMMKFLFVKVLLDPYDGLQEAKQWLH